MNTTDRSTPNLLPCPFCGTAPSLEDSDARDAASGERVGYTFVKCRECHTDHGAIGLNSLERAVAAWNRRAEPAAQAAQAGQSAAQPHRPEGISALLVDVIQLLRGWHVDTAWTAWDQSVCDRAVAMLADLTAAESTIARLAASRDEGNMALAAATITALTRERDELIRLVTLTEKERDRWRLDAGAHDVLRQQANQEHETELVAVEKERDEARRERDAWRAEVASVRIAAGHPGESSAPIVRMLDQTRRAEQDRDAAQAEVERIRATATDAINALMAVGSLIQNDHGTWKLRKHDQDMLALVVEVNRTVPIARATLAPKGKRPEQFDAEKERQANKVRESLGMGPAVMPWAIPTPSRPTASRPRRSPRPAAR